VTQHVALFKYSLFHGLHQLVEDWRRNGGEKRNLKQVADFEETLRHLLIVPRLIRPIDFQADLRFTLREERKSNQKTAPCYNFAWEDA
jgi:hypothetical protein